MCYAVTVRKEAMGALLTGRNSEAKSRAGEPEEAFSRDVLRKVEITKYPLWRRLLRKDPVIAATVFAVLFYIISLSASVYYTDQPLKLSYSIDQFLKGLTAIAAGFAFALTYIQWQLARHEVSFDKYYDRINIANQAIDKNEAGETPVDGQQIDHLRNMRVFAQLDNLEYIIGKYRLDFVEFDLLDRAIRAFRSECHVDRENGDIGWFSNKVLFWIGEEENQQIALGYHSATRKAARYIVERVSVALGQKDLLESGPMARQRRAHVAHVLATRRVDV
jgi:hypothetical protein